MREKIDTARLVYLYEQRDFDGLKKFIERLARTWDGLEATNPRVVVQDGHLYFREEDIKSYLTRHD